MLKIIRPCHHHKCEFPYIFKDRLYPVHEICEKYKDANETIISYKWNSTSASNYTKLLCVIKLNGPVVIITYNTYNVESISYDNIELAKLALDALFNS